MTCFESDVVKYVPPKFFPTLWNAWKYRNTTHVRGEFVVITEDGWRIARKTVINGCPQQGALVLPKATKDVAVSTYFVADGMFLFGPSYFINKGSVLTIELPHLENNELH